MRTVPFISAHRFLAAYFVQNVVMNYERHRKELQISEAAVHNESQPQVQEAEIKGKECSNLMVLLSELYNFQVISSVLVFDLIRQLLEDDMTEFNVELLLNLMRSVSIHSTVLEHILMFVLDSGQQLRQDDPSALKDIIDIVQKKASGQDERERSLRCVWSSRVSVQVTEGQVIITLGHVLWLRP